MQTLRATLRVEHLGLYITSSSIPTPTPTLTIENDRNSSANSKPTPTLTIENDRKSSANSNVVVGSIVAAVLVLLCFCGGTVMKWHRAKRYATRDADGIVTDNSSFKDEDDSNGSSNGDGPVVNGESPPSDAFVIS